MGDHELLLELWEDVDGPALLYAGPRGDGSRRLLSPNPRLVTTIWASSHFEAMTIYYQLLGRGEYRTDQPWDHQPFPQEWVREQRQAGITKRHT